MTPEVSIIYSTFRRQPHLEWFTRSLARECQNDGTWELIVVDRFWPPPKIFIYGSQLATVYINPKPTPWQGKYRHPKLDRDYFAASNARNTGVCFARGKLLVFVDDLSALCPRWWQGIKRALAGGYVMAGAYEKVSDLVVSDNGTITYNALPGGADSRWNIGSDREPVPIRGSETYGCNLAIPTDLLLRVNGWDECADGVGFEDSLLGERLARVCRVAKPDRMKKRAPAPMRYDRTCKIVEDAAGHYEPQNEVLHRLNRPIAGYRDLNWEMLARNGTQARGNDFNLAELRAAVLERGYEAFPTERKPFRFSDGEPAIVGL